MNIDDVEKRKSETPIIEGFADDEEPVIFHYSREHRIQSAPKIVQDYYNGNMSMGGGLFRCLVKTRASRMLLAAIAVMVFFIIFYGLFASGSANNTLAGIPVSLAAFSFEDSIYASVKCAQTDMFSEQNQIVISVEFRFLTDGENIFSEIKEEGIYSGKELFLRTTTIDYDIFTVEAIITANGEQIILDVPVSRN